MATANLKFSSELHRKGYVHQELFYRKRESFWGPFTGADVNSVVMTKNTKVGEGHEIIFELDGHLSGRIVKDKDKARGRGEEKRIFSSKITTTRYRTVVDNGDKWNGIDINKTYLNEHSNSITQLAKLSTKFYDQIKFDTVQSIPRDNITNRNATHTIKIDGAFGYDQLLDIEKTLRTSTGYSTGGYRRPPEPFTLSDGRRNWLFIVDPSIAHKLKKSANYQNLVYNADVRGNENRAIKGVFGKIGSLILVEADQFFGMVQGNVLDAKDIDKFSLEIPGMRQFDGNSNTWTGQEGFNPATDELYSRGVIVGTSAMQMAMGAAPDYRIQFSDDFKITSESALITVVNAQKTVLTSEVKDYVAKVADIDFGIISVDIKIS